MQYQRAKNVAWRRIGDQTVIVSLGRRRMLALNEAGAAVWDALARSSEAPSADPGSVRVIEAPDGVGLGEFLADLEQEGVLVRADGGSIELVAESAAPAAGLLPAVVWREELHRFGGSCGMLPTQSDLCNAKPWGS